MKNNSFFYQIYFVAAGKNNCTWEILQNIAVRMYSTRLIFPWGWKWMNVLFAVYFLLISSLMALRTKLSLNLSVCPALHEVHNYLFGVMFNARLLAEHHPVSRFTSSLWSDSSPEMRPTRVVSSANVRMELDRWVGERLTSNLDNHIQTLDSSNEAIIKIKPILPTWLTQWFMFSEPPVWLVIWSKSGFHGLITTCVKCCCSVLYQGSCLLELLQPFGPPQVDHPVLLGQCF